MVFFMTAVIASGCAGPAPVRSPELILLVPGAGGDGPWYDGIRGGLKDAGILTPVETVRWGAPLPLYMLNLQTRSIHRSAQRELARRIESFRKDYPKGQLSIVAHSAGCGVALGAMTDMPPGLRVDRMILLAPSVSPGYDLRRALEHLTGDLHVFFSGRDRLWLGWRSSTFGTYDNIKTKAAGNMGFDVSQLPETLRPRVIQHAYDPAWANLGNDGDHGGTLARRFVGEVIAGMMR